MLAKLKSRKLILAICGVVLPILGSYLTGEIPVADAITLSVGAICSYVFGQGVVDAAAAAKK